MQTLSFPTRSAQPHLYVRRPATMDEGPPTDPEHARRILPLRVDAANMVHVSAV